MPADVRILLLADSHLGFDLPLTPRVRRRRRGHDFLANYATALAPALRGEVDLVVHAGDVFNRSCVHPSLAYQAYEPLRRIAEQGTAVFVVPGNHERSRLPHPRLLEHRGVHVFDAPRTFVADVRGVRVALAGFPYERDNVRARFPELLRATQCTDVAADVRLLCLHHCVEGATVGPADYTFTTADDVIRSSDIPSSFAAVLSGHIHRHQVLTADLARRPRAAPVMYPGSIERTAFAEMNEPKGFMTLDIRCEEEVTVDWKFHPLPARPMIRAEIVVTGMAAEALARAVDDTIAAAPSDGVVMIRVIGELTGDQWAALSTTRIRAVAPDTMNVEIVPVTPAGAPPSDQRAGRVARAGASRQAKPRRESRTPTEASMHLFA